MLIDSCILIAHFRGDTTITHFLLQNQGKMKISSITDMEIAQGVRNKAELKAYEKLLQQLGIQIIDLSEEMSIKARLWLREYGLSHNLYLADALIAATAKTQNLPLLTLNLKDFRFLDIELISI